MTKATNNCAPSEDSDHHQPGHVLSLIELVFVLIMLLFVIYAHVNLCRFFSSAWCRGLTAASACGSSWTFLFTFSLSA